jgi:hypothetical protein
MPARLPSIVLTSNGWKAAWPLAFMLSAPLRKLLKFPPPTPGAACLPRAIMIRESPSRRKKAACEPLGTP